MEHLPDFLTAAGFCHYMLVARERGGQRRVRQWCFSPLDEEADTVWPWEQPRGPHPGLPKPAATPSFVAASSPAAGSSPPSSSSSSLGSSPAYSRSASLASLTSAASFSSFGGGGYNNGLAALNGSNSEDAFYSSSVAGDSDSSANSTSTRRSPLPVRRVRKQRRHRNPVPGAVREEDLDAVPAAATRIGLASDPGLSLEAVGALAAAVAGVRVLPSAAAAAAPAEGEGGKAEGKDALPPVALPPLYELCVNDCRHFVDDLAASLCGTRRAVREASRAHWRQMKEKQKAESSSSDDEDASGGHETLRGGEEVAAAGAAAVAAGAAVPFPTISLPEVPAPCLSFSPLREQKQQQEEEEEKRKQQERQRKSHTNSQQQRRSRRRSTPSLLHRGAGDAALRAAQLLTDVDHWPAVAAAGKALALGALSAALTRPAAALLPAAALSLVLPADVKPAASVAAAAVFRAPFDLAGATLRAGRDAAGAALRAATAGLRRRRGEQEEREQRRRRSSSAEGGSGSDGGNGGRNQAIPGLR